MPRYTYKCSQPDCLELDKEMEIQKRMSDPAPNCEKCNVEMDQVFNSAAHFSLKGSGWTGSNIAGKG